MSGCVEGREEGPDRIPVAFYDVLRRLNVELTARGQHLHVHAGSYYLLDLAKARAMTENEIERMARKLCAIAVFETVLPPPS
jgi:hypothetical protein